ncbi:MAG: hypothetical protein J6I53_10025 [Treponema sp.]|nr:hypothetical protein [Treponema sp.]
MKSFAMKNKPCIFVLFIVLSILLDSCADKLNEDKPEETKKLAEAIGFSYPLKKGGGSYSGGSSSGSSGKSFSVGDFHSGDISDYTEAYLSYGKSVSYSYTIKSGYIMYIQYHDSRSSDYSSICSDNGNRAATASIVVYDSSGNEYGEIDSTGTFFSNGAAGGTYKMKVTASSYGYVAVRVYQMPTYSYVNNTASCYSGSGNYSSSLTYAYLGSSSSVRFYKFYANFGYTYRLRFYDEDTKSSSSISSSSSYFPIVDGIGIIYSSDSGDMPVFTDSDEFPDSFVPQSSGYYIIAVGKAYSAVDDGYVGFRLYN